MKDFKTKNGFFTGNVGIGTTNPGAKLNIANTTADSNTFTISRAENAAISLFSIFQDSSWDIGGGQGSGIAHVNTNNRNLAITTSSDQSLDGGIFINESGNVGIGATNPTDKLYIKAGLNDLGATIENTSGNPARLTLTNSEGSGYVDCNNNLLRLSNNTSSDLVINSAGNVGIGTTNPESVLEVQGSQGYAASASDLITSVTKSALRVRGSNDSSDSLWMGVENQSANPYIQGSNGNGSNAKNISINPFGGNVGIGTTNSSNKLHIQQGVLTGGSTNSNTSVTIEDSSNTGIQFLSAGQTQLRFGDAADNGAGSIIYKHSNDTLTLNSRDKFIFNSGVGSGNVGIGTTDPVSPLTVEANPGSENTPVAWIHNSGNLSNYDGTVISSVNNGSDAEVLHIRTNNSSYSNGTSLMLVRGDGNVGIGTTNPGQKLDIYGKFTVNHDGVISWGPSGMGRQFWDSGKVIIRGESGNALHLGANGLNDHLIVNTSGSVGIGTTNPSSSRLDVWQTESTSDSCIKTVRPGTADRKHLVFYNGNGVVGDIKTSGSSTSYNTTSDYRLKENVVELTDALDRVCQLKPSRFNFIADKNKTVDGFLAHEVQEIVPEAINGEKDAVNEDGEPDYQGIDQSKIVPLLTAAIQEQQTIIEDLKARIETLES